MKSLDESTHPILGFIGGCHVAGYLVEDAGSFVDHLKDLFRSSEVIKVPYATISKIDKHINPTRKLRSKYVFVQLGNFEFSASWRQIIATTVGGTPELPSFISKYSKYSSRKQKTGSAAQASSAATAQRPSVGSKVAEVSASPLLSTSAFSLLDVTKAVVGSVLYFTTWVVLRKHRQQFNLMNQVVRQNPETTFVCISPLPVVAWPHNLLRRLGSFIFRQRLDASPNLQWLDSHRVLPREHALLADGIHLNEEGHRILAEHLYALCQPAQSQTRHHEALEMAENN
jgi:hypothetical protein